jgi:hypothetical protein
MLVSEAMLGNDMKTVRWILLFLLTAIHTALFAQDYTLKDVIGASTQINDQKTSILIAPFTGGFIKLNNKWYQVRFFFFEHKLSDADLSAPSKDRKKLTFGKFAKAFDLLSTKPTLASKDFTFYPIEYFSASKEIKKKGFNYMISLREVNDPNVLSRIKRNSKPSI